MTHHRDHKGTKHDVVAGSEQGPQRRSHGPRHDFEASNQSGAVMAKKVGLGLGYFSIALGLVELIAPGRVARFLGVEGGAARKTVVAMGIREMIAGVALIRGPAASANLWNRVIGDVADAAALTVAATRTTKPLNVALAGGLVAGAFVADLLTARALDRSTGRAFPRFHRPNDPVNKPVEGMTGKPAKQADLATA